MRCRQFASTHFEFLAAFQSPTESEIGWGLSFGNAPDFGARSSWWGSRPVYETKNEVRMKTKRTKRKNKYRELWAAIAAIRRNNGALLAVLPQWPEEWGRRGGRDSTGGGMVKETLKRVRETKGTK